MPALMVPPPLLMSLAQLITPAALTVSFPLLVKLVQLRVVMVSPPALWIPLAKVEVAEVEVILRRVASMAPESMVEVPVTVLRKAPPVMVNPADAAMPVAESPCTTVDVPVV